MLIVYFIIFMLLFIMEDFIVNMDLYIEYLIDLFILLNLFTLLLF
jgi:hypothetical protein